MCVYVYVSTILLIAAQSNTHTNTLVLQFHGFKIKTHN